MEMLRNRLEVTGLQGGKSQAGYQACMGFGSQDQNIPSDVSQDG